MKFRRYFRNCEEREETNYQYDHQLNRLKIRLKIDTSQSNLGEVFH